LKRGPARRTWKGENTRSCWLQATHPPRKRVYAMRRYALRNIYASLAGRPHLSCTAGFAKCRAAPRICQEKPFVCGQENMHVFCMTRRTKESRFCIEYNCFLSSESPDVCHGDMGRREAQTVKKLLTPHTILGILGEWYSGRVVFWEMI